ncbi:MAG: heme-binding protein [Salinivirgaceae bacterium]|nr:heme-binding protein [Salinivirgaceae bacterium]
MKYLAVGLILITIIFFVMQAYSSKTTRKTESYKYSVVKKYDGFEIRKYEASNFSYVTMNTSKYSESSRFGFRALAGYIFGGNEEQQSIAMTSPVAMSLDDSVTMMFMVPSEYEINDLPKPNNKNVKFKQEPEKTIAALTFGGWASDEKIEKYTEKLKFLLKENNIGHKNNFSYFGYNPPYEIVNRRNEIVVELKAQ